MQSPLRTFAIVLACVCLPTGLGIVRFDYPRAVENDPLKSPVQVEHVDGNRLTLADGRVFQVEVFDESLADLVKASEDRVDLEVIGDGRHADIFAKHRGWICGTPWVGIVNLPLIPVNVPINRRQLIGTAELVPAGDGEPLEPRL
jgi:hypothetical protein